MSEIKKIILSAAKKDFVGFQSVLESIVEEKFRDAIDTKVEAVKSTLFAEAKEEEDDEPDEEEDADGKDSEDDKKDEDNGKKKKENPFAKKD